MGKDNNLVKQQTPVKQYQANDRIFHIVFGASMVVCRHHAAYSSAPNDLINIKPDILPQDTAESRYAEIQLVQESSCTEIGY